MVFCCICAASSAGSSEWADCDSSRSAFGHTYHALNRLTLIRELYFDNNPFSFGQQKLKQDVQVRGYCMHCHQLFTNSTG